MKQTVHLHYWFWVTTVLLDDINDTFSACLHGFSPEKCPAILKFSCPEKNLQCPRLQLVPDLQSYISVYRGMMHTFGKAHNVSSYN